MTRTSSARLAMSALLTFWATAPLLAQTTTNVGSQPPPPPGQAVGARGYPYPVYVVPVQPRDARTPRQKCLDEESARIGGTLSDLDRRTIDLKCSQR